MTNTADLDFSLLEKPLAKSKTILIAITANPQLDMVAAGLALYLSLKKQGKDVSIVCPTAMTVAFNRLIGVNKISRQAGNRNLLISFDYLKEAIEKVSYNIENNKFNLVIEPKPGFPPLNKDKVSYSYTGLSAELIIIIGADKVEDLEDVYQQEKEIFNNKLTVNISHKASSSKFGKINLVNTQASCVSEIVTELIKNLNMPLDEDVATNLYSGIKSGSADFQAVNVGVKTFELAAFLLKNKAKKDHLTAETFSLPTKPANNSAFVTNQPNLTGIVQSTPSSSGVNKPQAPFLENNKEEKIKKPQPPPDWFKPKIYKGDKAV